jgi:superfamily II DNA or RNA helicase
MTATETDNRAFRKFDLVLGRDDDRPKREPAPHQVEALGKLTKWFSQATTSPRGGIVVLPTGGGKTFTAVRFLCQEVIADGYKVLWLAHTHHLLEQAADAFGRPDSVFADEAARVSEDRDALALRIVSGTTGHCRIHEIERSDDVVVCTLPSAARALRDAVPALMGFLEQAGDRLAVVFDEAHHAPAPTYARLLETLRAHCPKLVLLGLTATPTYTRKESRGWLKKLFPQEILHQVTASRLMADEILSRPHFEHVNTDYRATFTEREYSKWIATYQDLPERIVTQLAESRERNDFIASHYAKHKEHYGRTIIFADRWYQCDALCQALKKLKIRADVVYSHVTVDKGSSEDRGRRTSDDNSAVLASFRRGDLDVIVNVRMLTEGTDVPSAQTVFLTRQTTSPVLLTQMIGRALRGPKFGGTKDAFIVSFVDNWSVPITWADPVGRLQDGGIALEGAERTARLPVQLLSIELVRRLARQLSNPTGQSSGTFLSHMPIGWYQAEYDARVDGTEDIEAVSPLIMVYDVDETKFVSFITALPKLLIGELLETFQRDDVAADGVDVHLVAWSAKYFGVAAPDESRRLSLLHIARHIAQQGLAPAFFRFEARREHDLDLVARTLIAANAGPRDLRIALRAEFDRRDRFWKSLYPSFDLFERQYNGVQNRLLSELENGGAIKTSKRSATVTFAPPQATEPTDAFKRAVRARDGNKCLCCGATRRLEIDHVAPSYLGGPHDMENLQTLCRTCNSDKGVRELNFRRHGTPLVKRPEFALLPMPRPIDERSVEYWERYLRRTINFFYRCAAVQTVSIRLRGMGAGMWSVSLFPGNDARWMLNRFCWRLQEEIERVREQQRLFGPTSITIEGGSAVRAGRT